MDCDALYVGQMKKGLKTTLNEYVKNTHKLQKYFVILDYIFEHDHSMDWKNVKILNFEPKYHKINFSNNRGKK